MTLVGRERELDILRGALDRLLGGDGSFVLITGEAGIGKTRVVDEAIARARTRGATVAWGGAWDGGGAPAWWPWIQILRALADRIPAPDDRLRRDLGPLWSELEAGPDREDPELTRFRRLDALRAVLLAAARSGPLVVALEDLHAADLASVQALHFIARSQRALPVLVIGTRRGVEPQTSPAVTAELARAAREAIQVPLGPLDRSALAALVADLEPVSDQQIDQIYEATGGNPLYMTEAVRALRTGARDFLGGVRALIGARLATLAAAPREALELVAILGGDVSWEAIADLSGTPARERLEPAIVAGFLSEANAGVSFTHGLFRERLLEELRPERRRAMHLAAGRSLERHHRRGRAKAEEVATHLLAALPDGDPREAVAWASEAADETVRELAFDRAVTLLERAIAALDREPAQPVESLDLELRLAEVLARTGDGQRGRSVALAAANVARILGDGPALARAALAYGTELRIAIIDPVLIGLLEEALAMLDEHDLARRARVLARLAAARQPAPDPMQPVVEARRALDLARQSGDDDAQLHACDWAGAALSRYGPVTERARIARQLVVRAMARGDLVLAQRGHARLAIDAAELCEPDELDLAISDHARLADALGHARWRWLTPILHSMRALIVGQWDEAARAQAEAAGWIAQIDHPHAGRVLFLHRIGAFRHRWAGPLSGLFELFRLPPGVNPGDETIGRITRASIAARYDAPDMARQLIGDIAVEGIARSRDAVCALADTAVTLGDRRLAAQLLPLVRELEGPASTWGAVAYIWEGPISGLVGGLAATLEQWDLAIASYDEALELAAMLGARPYIARGKHVLSAALAGRGRSGDAARARSLCDEAAAEARSLDLPYLLGSIAKTRASLEGSSVAVPADPHDDVAWTMAREGEVWSISCREGVTRLKHSRALDLLDRLRQTPGREHHVLELLGHGDAVDTGDAGELLDAEAQRAYRRRIAELERELAEAEDWNDRGRCEQMRAELDALTDELARAVGLGGRTRRAGSAVERARINVHKRLRGVIQRIGESLPGLAAHLSRHVKTGTYVGYRVESHP